MEKTLTSGSSSSFSAAIGDVKRIDDCVFTIPEIKKPVHAQFKVKLDGTSIENSWNFWLFPKRNRKTVKGIAVTEDIFEKLDKRYAEIVKVGTPEAEAATMVIGSWDHPDLVEANKACKRSLMIGPAQGPAKR